MPTGQPGNPATDPSPASSSGQPRVRKIGRGPDNDIIGIGPEPEAGDDSRR
jgi:hypothetical protein